MIAHLSGRLLTKTTQSVIIDIGGIGYEVIVPLSTFYSLPNETEKVSLHIHTHVREDALLLFGFATQLERDLFLMLNSISGIGPKLSVNILSGIGPQDLLEAIASGDAVRLQRIPGVGRKTAERIALELKDRALKSLGERPAPEKRGDGLKHKRLKEDALSALLNLGYSPKAAKSAVEKAHATGESLSLENLIRKALKSMA
jgi:Holliday junction DNA helicase RuvA